MQPDIKKLKMGFAQAFDFLMSIYDQLYYR